MRTKLNKYIQIALYCFYGICYSHPLVIIRKKYNHIFLIRLIYLVTPIVILLLNLSFIFEINIFFSHPEYLAFSIDLSNSMILPVLFLLSYYAINYYMDIFHETLEVCIYDMDIKKELEKAKNQKNEPFIAYLLIFSFLFFINFKIAEYFYQFVKLQPTYWEYQLHTQSPFYSDFFILTLTIAWYNSFCLLAMIMFCSYIFYHIIKEKYFFYHEALFNTNPSVIKIFSLLILNFLFGFFYILSAILIILVDVYVKKQFQVDVFFTNKFSILALILLVFFLSFFAYIPIRELITFMKIHRSELFKSLQQAYSPVKIISKDENDEDFTKIKKNKIPTTLKLQIQIKSQQQLKQDFKAQANNRDIIIKLAKKNLIITTMENKFWVLFSAIIPLIALILQLISIYKIK